MSDVSPPLLSLETAELLLQLPDPCLIAVLSSLIDDLPSLFNTARSHSRLHQSALVALSSITARFNSQQQLDGCVRYLSKHGGHVGGINFFSERSVGTRLCLRELPSNLQLTSLQLNTCDLHVQSLQSTGLALKQLQFKQSWVLGAGWTVPVLFSQLSALEHLCYHSGFDSSMHGPHLTKKAFPITELLHLQRLTHLDIAGLVVHPSSPAQQGTPGWAVLQFLQQLTRLEDLRLQIVTYDFQTGARVHTRIYHIYIYQI